MLSSHFGWLHTWDHRHSWGEWEKVISTRQAASNGGQTPTDGFPQQMESDTDHKISQTEAKSLRTNLNFTLKTSFTSTSDQLCRVSMNLELHTYFFLQQQRDSSWTQAVRRVCVLKIKNAPEWDRAVITDSEVSLHYISCHFTPHLNQKHNQNRKKPQSQEELCWNHNKHVSLKHLWELQPSNKNTQALKSTSHCSRGLNPNQQIRAEKYNICLLCVAALSARTPERSQCNGET